MQYRIYGYTSKLQSGGYDKPTNRTGRMYNLHTIVRDWGRGHILPTNIYSDYEALFSDAQATRCSAPGRTKKSNLLGRTK